MQALPNPIRSLAQLNLQNTGYDLDKIEMLYVSTNHIALDQFYTSNGLLLTESKQDLQENFQNRVSAWIGNNEVKKSLDCLTLTQVECEQLLTEIKIEYELAFITTHLKKLLIKKIEFGYFNYLATMAYEQKSLDSANQYLHKCLALEPENIFIITKLAEVHYWQGDVAGFNSLVELARSIDSNNISMAKLIKQAKTHDDYFATHGEKLIKHKAVISDDIDFIIDSNPLASDFFVKQLQYAKKSLNGTSTLFVRHYFEAIKANPHSLESKLLKIRLAVYEGAIDKALDLLSDIQKKHSHNEILLNTQLDAVYFPYSMTDGTAISSELYQKQQAYTVKLSEIKKLKLRSSYYYQYLNDFINFQGKPASLSDNQLAALVENLIKLSNELKSNFSTLYEVRLSEILADKKLTKSQKTLLYQSISLSKKLILPDSYAHFGIYAMEELKNYPLAEAYFYKAHQLAPDNSKYRLYLDQLYIIKGTLIIDENYSFYEKIAAAAAIALAGCLTLFKKYFYEDIKKYYTENKNNIENLERKKELNAIYKAITAQINTAFSDWFKTPSSISSVESRCDEHEACKIVVDKKYLINMIELNQKSFAEVNGIYPYLPNKLFFNRKLLTAEFKLQLCRIFGRGLVMSDDEAITVDMTGQDLPSLENFYKKLTKLDKKHFSVFEQKIVQGAAKSYLAGKPWQLHERFNQIQLECKQLAEKFEQVNASQLTLDDKLINLASAQTSLLEFEATLNQHKSIDANIESNRYYKDALAFCKKAIALIVNINASNTADYLLPFKERLNQCQIDLAKLDKLSAQEGPLSASAEVEQQITTIDESMRSIEQSLVNAAATQTEFIKAIGELPKNFSKALAEFEQAKAYSAIKKPDNSKAFSQLETKRQARAVQKKSKQEKEEKQQEEAQKLKANRQKKPKELIALPVAEKIETAIKEVFPIEFIMRTDTQIVPSNQVVSYKGDEEIASSFTLPKSEKKVKQADKTEEQTKSALANDSLASLTILHDLTEALAQFYSFIQEAQTSKNINLTDPQHQQLVKRGLLIKLFYLFKSLQKFYDENNQRGDFRFMRNRLMHIKLEPQWSMIEASMDIFQAWLPLFKEQLTAVMPVAQLEQTLKQGLKQTPLYQYYREQCKDKNSTELSADIAYHVIVYTIQDIIDTIDVLDTQKERTVKIIASAALQHALMSLGAAFKWFYSNNQALHQILIANLALKELSTISRSIRAKIAYNPSSEEIGGLAGIRKLCLAYQEEAAAVQAMLTAPPSPTYFAESSATFFNQKATMETRQTESSSKPEESMETYRHWQI